MINDTLKVFLYFKQLVNKDMRSSSLDSTSYMSPASAVLAAAAAAVAEANGGQEDVDQHDGHTSFITYDQGTTTTTFRSFTKEVFFLSKRIV